MRTFSDEIGLMTSVTSAATNAERLCASEQGKSAYSFGLRRPLDTSLDAVPDFGPGMTERGWLGSEIEVDAMMYEHVKETDERRVTRVSKENALYCLGLLVKPLKSVNTREEVVSERRHA